jgi:hypothetical protein
MHACAGDITHLLCFVSLNLAGMRKILKKLAKHVKPSEPTPGFVALEISHPHEPGHRILQVGLLSVLSTTSVMHELFADSSHALHVLD